MRANPSHLLKKIPLSIILLITYLIIVIVVIAVFSYSSYVNTRDQYIDKTNISTLTLMEQQNSQLNSQVQFIIDACFDLARNDDLIRILKDYGKAEIFDQVQYDAQIKAITYNYWKFKEQIFNITIFVKDKKFVSDFINGVCPLSLIKDYDWFKALGQKTGILVDTHKFGYMDRIKDKDVTTSIVKITNINRKAASGQSFTQNASGTNDEYSGKDTDGSDVLGYVDIDILEDFFYNDYLKELKVSANSEVYVVNSEGIVVSSYNKQLIGKPYKLGTDAQNLQNIKEGGYRKISVDGRSELLIYTGLNSIGWRIVQLIPVSEIYAGEDRIVRMVGTTVILSILLIMPVIILISRFLSQPIRRLGELMNSVKMGKISKIEQTTYSKEIFELYNSYNYMVERINDLLADIQNANKIQRQTEIKALQAQINPHFLYNTLDSINWMALDNNIPDISKMVTMLSRLFRLSLSKGKTIYMISDELEQVGYYLEIQKIRFKDRFNYSIEVNDTIKSYYVPKLILQPLVENSLVHGFREMTTGGIIKITTELTGDRIYIDVTDNGAGIDTEKASRILSMDSREGGYGVKNVNERIKYACGNAYGLRYVFDGNTGTHVRVELPIITVPEQLRQ